MPPKRTTSSRKTTTTTTPTATAAATTKQRQTKTKLAKENDITAAEEAEIKEVFHLFSIRDKEGQFRDEKEGVIRRGDVRKALVALALPPTTPTELPSILSALDPTNTGLVPYPPFLAVAAAKLHARGDPETDTSAAAAVEADVDAAFRLFNRGSGGPITLSHLRGIARELKEERNVGEDLLRDMVLEANGGAGVHAGVTKEEFFGVLKRAGVF